MRLCLLEIIWVSNVYVAYYMLLHYTELGTCNFFLLYRRPWLDQELIHLSMQSLIFFCRKSKKQSTLCVITVSHTGEATVQSILFLLENGTKSLLEATGLKTKPAPISALDKDTVLNGSYSGLIMVRVLLQAQCCLLLVATEWVSWYCSTYRRTEQPIRTQY